MKEEKQTKMKKSTKYLLIGTLVLFLSILGASMAYYLARVSGNLSGKAAGTGLSLTINKVSSTDGDLIPLDNDEETLNQAILGYGNTSNNFDAAKSCIDINNYSVCQVYKVTLTNNGSVPVVVNSKVELSGEDTPNIDCTTMNDEKSVSNSNSCIGDNTIANNDTINGNSSKDYYVVVYIKNLDVPQYDKGEFNGTITFTSTDGDQVKGRFFKLVNLVEHITSLYNDAEKTVVTAPSDASDSTKTLDYNYATSVNLMNDRLGGTTESLDGGNIRYYGATPKNYIDIGDRTTDNQVILWRIIGVFDGKIRVIRDESIGYYSWDTSASNVNDGSGINEWSQADIMKLLNPGYENESVGGSLYWNSQSGSCYTSSNNKSHNCNFTNSGLSEGAKRYAIDQTLYLGGFNTIKVFVNDEYQEEREDNVWNSSKINKCGQPKYCNDEVDRALSWTGKVGLIYPSDYGYATDLSDVNCQSTLDSLSSCTATWMNGSLWTVSPWAEHAYSGIYISRQKGIGYNGMSLGGKSAIFPTLLLNSSVLAESGNGSFEHPYVLTS